MQHLPLTGQSIANTAISNMRNNVFDDEVKLKTREEQKLRKQHMLREKGCKL